MHERLVLLTLHAITFRHNKADHIHIVSYNVLDSLHAATALHVVRCKHDKAEYEDIVFPTICLVHCDSQIY